MSVYQRGDRWYYDFQIEGQRYRKHIPAAVTKAQAIHAEAVARQEVFHAEYGRPKGAMLFRDFVERHYLPYARVNNRSIATIESICRELGAAFGARRLAEITPLLIEKFKRERLATPTRYGRDRAPASINVSLAFLSKILSLAIDHRELHENPCRRVRLLRADNARNRHLTEEEEARLNAALEFYPTLRVIVAIALNTGMRRGEILKLRWSDVDFSRNTITVTNTKSGRDRQIPINEVVRQSLERLTHDAVSRIDDWLFPGAKPGTHLKHVDVSWKKVCAAAELENLRLHDLRHTAATRMAHAGADAFTIAAILGHSNIQMTARYAHATEESRRRAVAALPHVTTASQRPELKIA